MVCKHCETHCGNVGTNPAICKDFKIVPTFEAILGMFPNGEISEDNDGQLVVYTGLALSMEGEVVRYECD